MSPLSKRTFKQLSRDWDFNPDNEDADTLVANESSASNNNSMGQKRTIKMERKLVSKICRVIEQAKTQGRFYPNSGFRHQETVTACFSTVMYDIAKDYMYQFVSSDSSHLLSDESVDNVRLLKTNKDFYVKIITLFLKFREGYLAEFDK